MPEATRDSATPWKTWLLLLTVAGLLWVALAAWAFSSPVGSSPDDDFHIGGVYCAAGVVECPSPGQRVKPCFAADPAVAGSCQTHGRLTVPRMDGIASDYYPPVYNAVASQFIGQTVADSVRNIRLLNISIAVSMLMASVLLSRRSLRVAVSIGWLVFAVPLTVFLVSSINPNAWSILGLSAMWGPALSFVTTRASPSLDIARVCFVGLAAVMALGSRSEASLFVAALALALIAAVLPWPSGNLRSQPRLLLPVGLLATSALTFLVHGVDKSNRVFSRTIEPGLTGEQSLWQALSSPLAALGTPGIPANMLGWSDTIMPTVVSLTGVTALILAIAAGTRVMSLRKLVTIGAFGLPVLILICFLWAVAAHNTRFPPRYFLPTFIVTVGLVMLPQLHGSRWLRAAPVPGRKVLAVIAALVAVGNSVALLANTIRYTIGLTVQTPARPSVLRDGGQPWWWWDFFGLSPYGQWILGSLAFAAAVATGTAMLIISSRPLYHPATTNSHVPNSLHASTGHRWSGVHRLQPGAPPPARR